MLALILVVLVFLGNFCSVRGLKSPSFGQMQAARVSRWNMARNRNAWGRKSQLSMSSSTMNEIVVVKPSEEQVKVCKSWPVWGCGVSKFPWSYSERETALLIKGKCKVIPDDRSLPSVTLEAGDLVTFPAGMSCVWDVNEAISKHYNFG